MDPMVNILLSMILIQLVAMMRKLDQLVSLQKANGSTIEGRLDGEPKSSATEQPRKPPSRPGRSPV
jgi:hypothetical protein